MPAKCHVSPPGDGGFDPRVRAAEKAAHRADVEAALAVAGAAERVAIKHENEVFARVADMARVEFDSPRRHV